VECEVYEYPYRRNAINHEFGKERLFFEIQAQVHYARCRRNGSRANSAEGLIRPIVIRRVSTTLRQVLTEFSELFMCVELAC